MITIANKGMGNSNGGLVLWQNACLALIWVVWWERNAKFFEDMMRTSEVLWDTIHFLASFWASCTMFFKGIPLNVVQLDWISVRRSKGIG